MRVRDGSTVLNVPAHWRIVTSADRSPFACGAAGRPLRIVIDDVTASDCAATRLLRSFAGRSTLEVYGTSRGSARRVEIGSADERGVIPVEYVLPDGRGRRMAIVASNSWISRSAELASSEFGVSATEASRAITLAAACSRHEVDALVTASPALELGYWRNLAASAHAGSPQEATALMGLYLRARNDFTVKVEGTHSTFLEDSRFYPAAALATLPAYLPWLGGAVGIWRAEDDPSPYSLLRGLEIRLGRALRARDYFHVRIRSRRPDDAWDEALFFFEAVLPSLNGALDAAARFCHLVYRVPGTRKSASWLRESWRVRLLAKAPELTDLLDASKGSLIPCTTLVSVLRNYIHGEALSQELHRADQGPETIDYGAGALAVALPDADRLLTATRVLSSPAEWGVAEQHDGAVLVLPAPFLQHAVPTVLRVLGELMITAEPERFGSCRDESSFDPRYWLPDTGHEEALALLTGLDQVRHSSMP